jgi:hypothetical protein
MTISCAGVSKRLTGFGHKLPIVTRWMQCHFENPIGIHIADFAVCSDRRERGVIRSPTAYNELPNAAGRINCRIRCLRRKSFINMVMPVQDDINIIIVESLPNGLRIG